MMNNLHNKEKTLRIQAGDAVLIKWEERNLETLKLRIVENVHKGKTTW